MAEVCVEHNYVLVYGEEEEKKKKKWTVPNTLIKEIDNSPWLMVRCSNPTFCKLLGYTGAASYCSMKSSEGIQFLLKKRNEACLKKDPLFASEPSKKRRKMLAELARAPAEEELPFILVELEGHGQLKILRAKKINDDLVVPLEAESLKVLFAYLKAKGLTFVGSTRPYNKTGNFTKQALAARGSKQPDEPEAAEEEASD